MGFYIKKYPYAAAVAVFIATLALPAPFALTFMGLGWGLGPLQLLIPIIESAFILYLLYHLGWMATAGFTQRIKQMRLLWLPVLLMFLPAALFGTVQISAYDTCFYLLALFFTGVSEEAFARAFLLIVLLPKGKWPAILTASAIFSVSHITNLLAHDMGFAGLMEKFFVTFSFGFLYCALFIRTQNIWPLIMTHAIFDFSFLISGTAGPFTVTPFPAGPHLAIGAVSVAYGVYILRNIDIGKTMEEMGIER